MIRVCFVCLGNICRSPTADGIMQHLVQSAGLGHVIDVDSAGTGGWHVGEAADRRARAVAKQRGYQLTSRARQFKRPDFTRFDYILAMDRQNHSDIMAMAQRPEERARVHLFRAFDPELKRGSDGRLDEAVADTADADVPDPYYGGDRGFDTVFDMCERTCAALLHHIQSEHQLPAEPPA